MHPGHEETEDDPSERPNAQSTVGYDYDLGKSTTKFGDYTIIDEVAGEVDGQHFFTMGFVDGDSLAERLRHTPLFEPSVRYWTG